MNSFWESKTMRLIVITMLAIVLIFLVAAVLQALLDVRIPYVAETFAALTGNAGIGTARNAYVDAPSRRDEAAVNLASPPTVPEI